MTGSTHNLSRQSAGPNPLRSLPSVSDVLESFGDIQLAPHILTELIRGVLAEARNEIQAGRSLDRDSIIERCHSAIDTIADTRCNPVINGTGIVLHTNLGRAPVSDAAARAMMLAAASYVPLEIDPESNQRGGRMDEVSHLMHLLTGAETTLVVNNNAAAVLLTLAALCAEREVIVSRGEAVEIGGGFRIPDVIARSGCQLVEVGTTNRTYSNDFRRAVRETTAAFLKVHTSNFRVEGFTSMVASAELSELAREFDLPLIEDLGSGALLDTTRFGLRREMTVRESIAAGVSVVTFSGDKLLGGPQAGIIAGQQHIIRQIERHPLARALRVDKITLAGIVATLRHYVRGEAEIEIPIWKMIGVPIEDLTVRARKIATPLGLPVAPSTSSIGGGSLPGEALPSMAIGIATDHPDGIARKLRIGSPAVFPFIRDKTVLIDLRTVLPEQDRELTTALERALA